MLRDSNLRLVRSGNRRRATRRGCPRERSSRTPARAYRSGRQGHRAGTMLGSAHADTATRGCTRYRKHGEKAGWQVMSLHRKENGGIILLGSEASLLMISSRFLIVCLPQTGLPMRCCRAGAAGTQRRLSMSRRPISISNTTSPIKGHANHLKSCLAAFPCTGPINYRHKKAVELEGPPPVNRVVHEQGSFSRAEPAPTQWQFLVLAGLSEPAATDRRPL